MEYTSLGFSGIEVSKVCLGGMSFGVPTPDHHQWTIDEEASERVIDSTLSRLGTDYLEEPYVAHELVEPVGRPGEKPLVGTVPPKQCEEA